MGTNENRKSFDVIVAGIGAMGSAAVYHLAQRGQKVLGVERFDIPHSMGSFHGVNRIIRLAYYEDPSYVPLLRRSFELWRALQTEVDEQLLVVTGSVDASSPTGEVFTGSLRSCQLHDIPHNVLDSKELSARFPGFSLPADHVALFQPDGGFLLSERCVVGFVNRAVESGAEIHARERLLGWEPVGERVRVATNRATYEADQLILSPGAWMGSLVPRLQSLAVAERQVLAWFQPWRPQWFTPEAFPVFNLTVDEGRFYGFPVYGIPGFKVGKYHHLEELVDPETMEREAHPADEVLLRAFTDRYFPAASGPVMSLKSCIFTNTPDEHFIIDRLPGAPQVLIASPCSGHGFKFASVIGEILADLAIDGETGLDISLFQLDRFS